MHKQHISRLKHVKIKFFALFRIYPLTFHVFQSKICPPAAKAAGGRLLSYAPGCYTVPVTVRTLCPGVTVQEQSAFWVNVASGTVSLPATVAKAPVAAS